LVIFFEIEVKV